jgi:hypothetical protein
MNWIALQALSGVAIATLTLVLLLATIFYAWSNWRTMQLMEADIRHRTQPLPDVKLGSTVFNDGINGAFVQFNVTVTTANAPLFIRDLYVEVTDQFRNTLYEQKVFEGNSPLAIGERFSFLDQYQNYENAQRWRAPLSYTDLAQLTSFVSFFGHHNTVETRMVSTAPGPIRKLLAKWKSTIEEMDQS